MLEPASGNAPVKPMPEVQIAQEKRQFMPRVTLITVGTAVNFPNFDTVRHHVYSFSKAKTFEIKLYAGVPSKPEVFDKPGIAVLGCNICGNYLKDGAAWISIIDLMEERPALLDRLVLEFSQTEPFEDLDMVSGMIDLIRSMRSSPSDSSCARRCSEGNARGSMPIAPKCLRNESGDPKLTQAYP